jgi:hypothetical protein
MTRDDIISMAWEAGANRSSNPDKWDILEIRDTDLERFAALVAAHEREECAKACENYTDNGGEKFADHEGHGYECATAIRARGEK